MRRLLVLIALAALAITAAAPSSAWAAEVPTATASVAGDLLDAGTIDVQWWMEAEPGQAIAIVSTTIDPSVSLPVRVRLPIPPGMSVDWAGEVSGADATQDIRAPVLRGARRGRPVCRVRGLDVSSRADRSFGHPAHIRWERRDGESRVRAVGAFRLGLRSPCGCLRARPTRRSNPRRKGRQAPTRTARPSTRFLQPDRSSGSRA